MARDPSFIVEAWHVDPERPVMLVDEVREAEAGVEFVTFSCILLRANVAFELLKWAHSARAKIKGQSNTITFKGSSLFGNKKNSQHDPIRHYVFHALTEINGAGLFVTSSKEITAQNKTLTGGITLNAEPGDGVGGRVKGRELPYLMGFLKKMAIDWGLGSVDADAIIDRSAQFGADPRQRGIDPNTFEVWGPETLNRLSDGSPSAVICDTRFRFIMASDEGVTFRDLLLLPDAIGYLGAKGNAFEAAKQKVREGNPGWVYLADLPGLKAVAARLIETAKAAQKEQYAGKPQKGNQ
ncbi:hypothetical protein WDW37_19045 [Bdellovibrionota bacterium FG-1]